ncbi:hypothetical protein [Streptomyces synnematoformans]|uniref:Tail assembly chaperone n=1 Tax=Streptomyces synnematoformans TaxID=415721 RepID=A0ABN2XBY4_9ACTN
MPTNRTSRQLEASDEALQEATAQEAEAEHDPDDPYVLVPLAGHDGITKDVRALPAGKWRASAMRALVGGDMDGFMDLVLHPDDIDIYEELDPDMDAFGHFAQKASEAGGDDLGKSSGRGRSGRRTRRR